MWIQNDEELRQIVRGVLNEIEFDNRLSVIEMALEKIETTNYNEINDVRKELEEIYMKIDSIEDTLNKIKDSDVFDDTKDFTLVLYKNLAEINAGIKTILNRI